MGDYCMSIYIARSPAVAARSLDGEMIIMSTKDSKLFTLNEVATEIWQAADGRTPLSQIVQDVVCAKFEAEPEAAYADAEDRGIPISVHLDLTWACNEGCVHCYLDHSVGGDMDTAEIKAYSTSWPR